MYQEFPPAKNQKTSWPWALPTFNDSQRNPYKYSPPKISIVTPSYNQSPFIEETIRSVLLQCYPNLEYIIIDGGSTDGSIEIIKKYEPWLTYWESKSDHGQSHAINKGWQMASGEILAWINSDDVLLPGCLIEVGKLWQECKCYGFISGITERIDQNGEVIGKPFGSEFSLEESLITSINPIAQQSTFISRSALDQVGLLDENLHMSMDWDLWLRIGVIFPVKFVPSVWSQNRQWPETKTSKMLIISGQEHIKIIKKLFKNESNHLSKSLYKKALSAAHGRSAVLFASENNKHQVRKELIHSLLNCPQMKGGPAKNLLPKAFLIIKIYKYIKNVIKKFISKLEGLSENLI